MMSIPPDSPQWLRRCGVTVIRLLFLATAISVVAPTFVFATESDPQIAASEALRPYLGKWRPTSYGNGLYMVSITVTEAGLSIETGGSVTYEVVKKTDEGVIVRITDRHATNPHLGLTHPHTIAFGFVAEKKALTGPPPKGVTRTRDQFRICYGYGDIDSAVHELISEMKSGICPDVYIR